MLALCVSSLSQNTAISTKCAGAASFQISPQTRPRSIFSSSHRPTPIFASVGNKVREAADVFVVSRSQPIAPDHLHRALLAAVGHEAKKKPSRVIVAFARALVERAADRQFDEPAPREHRIGGEIDLDMPKQH